MDGGEIDRGGGGDVPGGLTKVPDIPRAKLRSHPNDALGAEPHRATARSSGESTRPFDRCMIAASISRA
ncbi:hypothetical protein N9M16_01335 [Candidatus Dependentiae bacterium]|nr:hypothetical protein [Candidatus Dependentiae bacterium]